MDAIKLIRKQATHDNTVNEVTNARNDGITQYPNLKGRLDAMGTNITNIDNKVIAAIDGLQWKPSVANYAALKTTYPNAKEGWTASVNDTNEIYRYDDESATWKKIADFSTIPVATTSQNGLMSSKDKSKLDGIDTSKLINTTGGQTISGNLTVNGGVVGNSSTATKLQNSRAITLQGDATGSAQFDGSANAVIDTTLSNVNRSNTTASEKPNHGGTFTTIGSITTDTKGRVTGVQTKTITLPNVNATVNLTMDIKEATVSTATATQVLIGAEVRATDIVRVYLSGVRLHPTKHYTLTFGNAQTAKITPASGVQFLQNDHFTFEILRAALA